MRLMGSQPLHAKAGNLGPRLHQAVMEAQAATSPYNADINSKPEQAESDMQGMGEALQQKQRRFMALPNRPSSIRKTPVPGSARRAPALDVPAVSHVPYIHVLATNVTSSALCTIPGYYCAIREHTSPCRALAAASFLHIQSTTKLLIGAMLAA